MIAAEAEPNDNALSRIYCTHHKCASHYQKDIDARSRRIKASHVTRDPRDIIVFGFFSHKWSHPIENEAHEEYRKWLNSVSDEEGLLFEVAHGGFQPSISNF